MRFIKKIGLLILLTLGLWSFFLFILWIMFKFIFMLTSYTTFANIMVMVLV
jgi:hypothetical protein